MKRGSDSPGSATPRVPHGAIGSPPAKNKVQRQAPKELAVMDVSDGADLKARCTTEDLRVFVLQKFKNMEKGETELEGRFTEAINALRAETKDELQKGVGKAQYMQDMDGLNAMRDKLNDFADRVQQWAVRIENLEATFREHTDVAFHLDNADLQRLKIHIEGVQTDVTKGKSQATMGSPATSAVEELMRGQLRAMEKSVNILRDTQAEHRKELDQNREDTKTLEDGNLVLKTDINTVNADILALKQLSGAAGVGGGPPGMAAPSQGVQHANGGWTCHCGHLHALDQRVQVVEAQALAAHARATAAATEPLPVHPPDFWAAAAHSRWGRPTASGPTMRASAQRFCGSTGCGHGAGGCHGGAPGHCGASGGAPGLGGHGGAGSGAPGAPGGGPSGAGGAPPPPPGGSGWSTTAPRAQWPDLTKIDFARIFDDKVANNSSYYYDGLKDVEKWLKRTRGYFGSKVSEMLPILRYAEEICDDDMVMEKIIEQANFGKWMTEIDMRGISRAVWGFLNSCLQDSALACFENAEDLNGFEGWRLIVQSINRSQKVHVGLRRRIANNPPKIQSLQHVSGGLVKFQATMKDWINVSGQISGHELKNDLM